MSAGSEATEAKVAVKVAAVIDNAEAVAKVAHELKPSSNVRWNSMPTVTACLAKKNYKKWPRTCLNEAVVAAADAVVLAAVKVVVAKAADVPAADRSKQSFENLPAPEADVWKIQFPDVGFMHIAPASSATRDFKRSGETASSQIE